MEILEAVVTAETRPYQLEWAPSVRMWVVKRDEQPVAWFDGEQLEEAQQFIKDMNAEELDEAEAAKADAI